MLKRALFPLLILVIGGGIWAQKVPYEEALRESLLKRQLSPEWLLRLEKGKPQEVESLLKLTPEQIERFRMGQLPPESLEVPLFPETMVTPPLEELSEIERIYQRGVSLSVSKEITQFGYDAFRGITPPPSSSFLVPVSSEYILGPGDEVLINIWGKIQESLSYTIDRDGKIVLPKAGILYLWGKTFEEASKEIKKALLLYYSNVDIDVTLGKLRSVQVFLLGEVRKPGAIAVPPQSTPFQVFLYGGGIKKTGSLRNIKWIHRDGSVTYVDLYDLLIWGKKESNEPFENGDVLFVPPIGPVVGIAGSVRRPAIYETKGKEDLSDLLKMCGGIGSFAYTKRLQVERVKGHKRKVVLDIELNGESPKNLNYGMRDGDLVLVFPVSPLRRFYVSIKGNVVRPGDYQWKPGLRVSDLIKEAEGLARGTFMERAEIFRYYSGSRRRIQAFNLEMALKGDTAYDPLLHEWDVVRIYSIREALPPQYVTIEGAVYNPGRYELLPNMRLSDLVFQAGGLIRGAAIDRVEIFRFPERGEPQILRLDFSLKENKEMRLEPDDYVFVRTGAQWLKTHLVSIAGEVEFPGTYPISDTETLQSLIEKAGGFTESSFPEGIVLIRSSVKSIQSQALAEFIRSTKMSLLQEEASLEKGGLTVEEVRERREYLKIRSQLVDLLSKIPVFGRIVLDFESGNPFSLTLEEGDSIYVPALPNTVQIIGSVYNPSAVAYQEGLSLNDYIEKVGGFREEADRTRTYVLKASGKVEKKPKKIERGDTIIVPEKFKVRTPTRKLIQDVANIVYQLSFAALAISSVSRVSK